jgi:hypothetical protein
MLSFPRVSSIATIFITVISGSILWLIQSKIRILTIWRNLRDLKKVDITTIFDICYIFIEVFK